MKQTPKEDHDLLYESLLQLNNVEECRRFMEDLCTVTELKAMRQRIEVAMYLREGMIYQDILKHTGASSATISRVNRCLQYGADGYQTVLPRLDPIWEEKKKPCRSASAAISGEPNTRLTAVCASSKFPRMAMTPTLFPACVAICFCWMRLTPPVG